MGAVASAFILVAALICSKWHYLGYTAESWSLGVTGGALFLSNDEPNLRQPLGFEVGDAVSGWDDLANAWFQKGLVPKTVRVGDLYYRWIPLWLPFIAVGIPTAGLWWIDRRHPAPGSCRCGYDLTGNTSGVCPECGQLVAYLL